VRLSTISVALVATALAACAASPAASASPLTGDPARYLLNIDQLVSPDFGVAQETHAVNASTLAEGDAATLQRLQSDGLQAAASIDYFRQVALALANGPVEVTSTVERFASVTGATDFYTADVARRDASPGETPLSAGSLGDAAHADSLVRPTTNGIPAVQVTIEWRVANLVNVLIVRGRYGGTRLDDALLLAHRQAVSETTG
jgi:hypothetical protein